ncbi:TOPRIM domain protein [Methanocaldococcus vulcanius M7]|uniref:DNA primase DnaG n=1 Tax=Methanocaldococcus vulcanius (strain ATCC 700851 / DSM 12094 / M7) TaxID=579137 RepID=C9RHZ3_METVM|nr:DNA primase DnaG [Methanocaldococcus vulcanius]ACX73195.1 TOPRIM domain protein [Methanocaldococcus vulcanius M7]
MDLGTTKYIIHAELIADGYVEKHDIIGAIFGQTEGLLGDELDLRELQKTGRVGRIDVELSNINGKSIAKITVPSSLDRIETSILAATLETIDRVGPCVATVKVIDIEDIRKKKRDYIVDRAKEILKQLMNNIDINTIVEEVKESVRMGEIIEYGPEKLPAGPAVDTSDDIIVVEGRADVLNLLRCGIKNVIAVEGTSVPKTIIDLSKKKIITVFTDGDRGGELILKELLQVCDVDFVARAPQGREVEELSKKEIMKCLRSKVPVEHVLPQITKDLKEGYKLETKLEKTCKIDKIDKVEDKLCKEAIKTSISEILNEKCDEIHPLLKKYKKFYEKFETLNESELLIICGDNEEKISIEELSSKIDDYENIDAIIVKGDINQKMVDNLYEKTNLIFCNDANIIKKPANLSLIIFGDLNAQR